MTRADWVLVAAYISAAVVKDFTEHQAEVYFDLLQDLPTAAVQIAAKQCLLESIYPTIPTVGAIRKAATAAATGSHRLPLAIEAWESAFWAVGRYGLSREREALATMPPAVAKAVRAIGWRALCDTKLDDLDTLRAHFLKAYEAMAARDQRQGLLPNSLKETIEAIGIDAQPAPLDNRTGAEILKGLRLLNT
jgi:hypothetical protein